MYQIVKLSYLYLLSLPIQKLSKESTKVGGKYFEV